MKQRQSQALGNLACPIDGSALTPGADGSLRCENGHSFDRAREGYFNLLLVQHKASRDPGDSKLMVAARRRVLQAGHYAPITERTAALVKAFAAPAMRDEPALILDAGCGEGYYLEQIASACADHRFQFAGIDISKWAIQAAAKRDVACFWAVASNRHPPFRERSIDLILSMFGFAVWDEFAKLQAAGRHALLVDAGPEHLIELREIIYPEVKRSEAPTLKASVDAGYAEVANERLQFTTTLASPAEIADLLSMTPHAHRANAEGQAALRRLETLAVTGDVVLRVLRREQE